MNIENQNPSNGVYELPVTDTGIDELLPEAQAELGTKLEQDREAIQAAIEDKFTSHAEMVQQNADGSQELTLYMPWHGGGIHGHETATIQLSRRTDSAGGVATDLTFSSRHAWPSRSRVVTVDGNTRVQGMTAGSDGTWTASRHDIERLNASTWRSNLETAKPEKPGFMRRALGRLVVERVHKG